MKYTVAVDFDGVIHSYVQPWVDHHVIPDPPVEGVIDWLNGIVKDFVVVIFTTRGSTDAGCTAVRDYLVQHGAHDWATYVVVTDKKPPALIYLDDRAYRFDGTNFPSAGDILRARPWNKP